MTYKLTGLEPYQIPTNADLGSLAYQNSDALSVGLFNVANTASISGLVANLTVGQSQAAAGTLLLLNQVPTNITVGQVITGTNIVAGSIITSVVPGFSTYQPTLISNTASNIVAMTATYGVSAGMAIYGTGVTYGTTVSSIAGPSVRTTYAATSATGAGYTVYVGTTTNIGVNTVVTGTNIDTGSFVVSVVSNVSVTLNKAVVSTGVVAGGALNFAPTVVLSAAIAANTLTQNILFYPTITLTQATSGAVTQNSVVGINYNPTSAQSAALVVQSGGLGVSGNSFFNNTLFANTVTITGNALSASTNTGNLVVQGGAGIWQNLYVGGNLNVSGTISGSFAGSINTATNLAGGTAGSIPYQSAPGLTSFIGIGTTGTLLVSNGTTASFTNTVASLVVSNTTASNSTNTGALVVAGGVGIGGDLWLGGTTVGWKNTLTKNIVIGAPDGNGSGANTNLYLSNALATNPPNQTALIFGTWTGGQLAAITWQNAITNMDIFGYYGVQLRAGNVGAGLTLSSTGTVSVPTTATSISTTTGALTVAGGVGIGGGVYVGGGLFVSNTTSAISTNTGALQVAGGVGVGGNIFAGGILTATQITQTSQQVRIGISAGGVSQGGLSTAVGAFAGQLYQGLSATAIGQSAGDTQQGAYATAVGYQAGGYQQGAYSLALGYNAGAGQATAAGSIILSAGQTTWIQTATNAGFYVSPIRGDASTSATGYSLFYNPVTKEITTATIGLATTATFARNINGGTVGSLLVQTGTNSTGFVTPVNTSGYTLQSVANSTPQWVDLTPQVLNDISNQFDGSKVVFDLRVDQNSINTTVDSKDVEVVINGLRLTPYVDTYTYPWITPYNSFRGFKVVAGKLILYNAPYRGDSSYVMLRPGTTVRQKRRYPFSATAVALGD